MAKINVSVKFTNSSDGIVMVGIGGQILHFRNSETQSINLDPKIYIATIAGVLDPNEGATVEVIIKQGSNVLSSRMINDKKFIKKQFVTIQ